MRSRSILRTACATCDRVRSLPLALLSLALLGSGPAASAAQWEEKFFNPAPAVDDVVLPLPCDGAMVFRKVTVPAGGPLDDYQITLGSSDATQGFAEASRITQIAGSFPDGKAKRYFLIAKYEISQLQYEAVNAAASDKCPTPKLPGRMAQGSVTWLDAMNFADRYSLWLRLNAKDKLPRDGDEIGYVRLPTETEWEFAARGGGAVSPSDFQERTYPMPQGLTAHVWFGSSQSAAGKPQLTGLLKPNPLGLHDMLGNMDEIVLEPFRAAKLGRLHGQAGGYVVRGGNFLTAEADIRSAYRQEVPLYQGDGPRRAKTSGFRPVVAGPVITSNARLQEIKTAWSALGSQSQAEKPTPTKPDALAGGKASDDPIEELAIIGKAAESPAMRQRLEKLGLALRQNIAERDEQRDRTARSTLRLGAFLGQKLRDDARAVEALRSIVKGREATAPDEERTKKLHQQLQADEAVLSDNLKYYADTVLGTSGNYSTDTITHQRDILSVELSSLGVSTLVPYLQKHVDHITRFQKDGKITRAQWLDEWLKMGK